MAIAIVLVLIAVGSVVFHVLSPWWWTPIASNWNYIDNTIIITFWITGVVFAAVVLFMAYCVFRFRHKDGRQRAHYEPENKRLESWLAGRDRRRRRRDAGARACSSGASSSRSQPTPPRSRSSASNGNGASACPARTASSARPTRAGHQSDNPLGLNPQRSERAGRRHHRRRRPAPAGRQAGQGAAALDRRAARFLRAASSAPRWTWCRASVTYFWFTPTRPAPSKSCAPSFAASGHPQMRGGRGRHGAATTRRGCKQQQTFAQLTAPQQKGATSRSE